MTTAAQVTPEQFSARLRGLVISIFGLATAACVLYVLQFPPREALSVLGAAAAVAGASGAVGSFIGFLFGVPKTLQSDQPGAAGTTYLANTNLEQISDWLTKILVGIGLVQIARVPDALSQLADALSPAFGGVDTSGVFALSLALYFAIGGLALTYLWTRTFLSRILRASDQEVSSQIKDLLQVAADANAQALVLVNRVLKDQSPPQQDDLNAAVGEATPDCLVTIYQQAEEQRLRNWITSKDVMARTIPVFRALAAADPRQEYFRHYGSLGFALKDQLVPAYEDALDALDTAISIRNRRGTRGLGIYEWNRALCRIQLDPDYQAGRASQPKLRKPIEADLRIAAGQLTDEYFQGGDSGKDAIQGWLGLNQLDLAALRQ